MEESSDCVGGGRIKGPEGGKRDEGRNQGRGWTNGGIP